jgi:hypothetical protein
MPLPQTISSAGDMRQTREESRMRWVVDGGCHGRIIFRHVRD